MWQALTKRVMVFFFNDTATTEIYTLSLLDALPIYELRLELVLRPRRVVLERDDRPDLAVVKPDDARLLVEVRLRAREDLDRDRKSTRLNSSHANFSHAVFCLTKKKVART